MYSFNVKKTNLFNCKYYVNSTSTTTLVQALRFAITWLEITCSHYGVVSFTGNLYPSFVLIKSWGLDSLQTSTCPLRSKGMCQERDVIFQHN